MLTFNFKTNAEVAGETDYLVTKGFLSSHLALKILEPLKWKLLNLLSRSSIQLFS